MSNPIPSILDAALEASRLADALLCASRQGWAEIEHSLRDQIADLARHRARLRVSGLPPIHAQDAGDRQLWEWDMGEALDELLAAVKEHIEAARSAPPFPECDLLDPDPERFTRYNAAILEPQRACLAAKKREDGARQRLFALAGRIDMTLAAPLPSAAPAVPALLLAGAPLVDGPSIDGHDCHQQEMPLAGTPADPFTDFIRHQRTLLLTLWRKGKVPIETVLRELYGTDSNDNLEALQQVIKRTNKKLATAEMVQRFEVSRRGEFLELREV